jgi:hypothetical protein
MQSAPYFKFDKYEIDIPKGEAKFYYELGIPEKTFHFLETLKFTPPPGYQDTPEHAATLHSIGQSLLLMFGISYWKTYCPKKIILPFGLSEKQAVFWNLLYTKGLGEFYYENKIDYRNLVQFPFEKNMFGTKRNIVRKNRSLVLLGGGKDSIVSAELLKASQKEFSLFALGEYAMHKPIAKEIGKPFVTMTRIMDSQLFELNAKGAYNGHVPISAIYAFTSLFAAFIYDFKYIVTSNEESANYGNVMYLDNEINHQWSKSFEFEQAFQQYVDEYISPGMTYFSLLRPYREIKITELFSHYPKYFHIFSSCNNNFSLKNQKEDAFWCGACPKCAFIFLLLSAFLPKSEVVSIFQKNLFANTALLKTYKQLLGLEGVKPFDCVGTPEESLYALSLVIKRREFTEDAIMRELSDILTDKMGQISQKGAKLLETMSLDTIPNEFHSIFNI